MKKGTKGLLMVFLVLICLAGGVLGIFRVSGGSVLWGRYLRAEDGSHIIITSRGGPIVMKDSTGTLFQNLEDGDRVLLACSGIQESYPARSRAYWCVRVEQGTADDLPEDTLAQLKELGWLPAEE